MKALWAVLMVAVATLLVCGGGVQAEDLPAADAEAPAAAPQEEQPSLDQQVKELSAQLSAVMQELSKLSRKYREDPEVAAAKKVADDANAAYKKLLDDKISSDPEGPGLRQKKEELGKQLMELKTKQMGIILDEKLKTAPAGEPAAK